MASAPRGQAPETSTARAAQCSRSAAVMTASSAQVREPVTSTRRGRAGATAEAVRGVAVGGGEAGHGGEGLPDLLGLLGVARRAGSS